MAVGTTMGNLRNCCYGFYYWYIATATADSSSPRTGAEARVLDVANHRK